MFGVLVGLAEPGVRNINQQYQEVVFESQLESVLSNAATTSGGNSGREAA